LVAGAKNWDALSADFPPATPRHFGGSGDCADNGSTARLRVGFERGEKIFSLPLRCRSAHGRPAVVETRHETYFDDTLPRHAMK
jgi:hypothetical protein